MRFSKPLPVRRWSTRERLYAFVLFALLNAFLVLTMIHSGDFPKTPDKWLVGSLTIITVPIIFVAIFEFLSGWLDKSDGEWLEEGAGCFGIILFGLFVGFDFAIFILLSDLRRRLGVLDYGAVWTTGSVVLGNVAAVIAIYEFMRRRTRR